MSLNPDEVLLAQKRGEFIVELTRELLHKPLAITSHRWSRELVSGVVSGEFIARLHIHMVNPDPEAMKRHLETFYPDELRDCELTIEQIEVVE